MMVFSFVVPIIASILYVIVFQKAGLTGLWLAVCAAPVLSAFLTAMFFGALYGHGMSGPFVVMQIVLSLAPLLVLAFKPWPPAAHPRSKEAE